ncbi:MAG: hypothetical protein II401_11545 [Bacteroidales bacterium]|nr:hypothetical protein [Bacteroidales bacterium]
MTLLFIAITALATAITAIVAFLSWKNERAKKRVSVFSESIRIVLDGIKNSESKDYILSNNLYADVETAKRYLGLGNNVKIGLDDFEEIVVKNRINDSLNISEEEKNKTKERLRKSYKKIEYFCERMDYLGIIAEDKDSRELIVKYFRSTIIDTYERLDDIIIKTRKDRNKYDLYEHYMKLYELAKEGDK